MSNFSTKGYEAKDFGDSKYISPGIVVARIKEITYGESSKKKTPYLEIHFEEMDEKTKKPTGKEGTTVWYLSEKAWEPDKGTGTKWRVAYLADKLGMRSALDKVTETASSAEEFVQGINKVFKGKVGRFVFSGEEIAPSDPSKSSWIKASLRNYKFVEPVNQNPSTLTFDETKDIKRFPVQPNDNPNLTNAGLEEDPFETSAETEDDLW
jgi:hypothetical protein